jgi:transcriptional regulator with XRE-family HTH domain
MTDHSTVTGRLRELRELARVTIQDAAAEIGVSYASFWNAERGYRKLKDHQLELLEAFYAQKINERLKAVSRSLGAEGN